MVNQLEYFFITYNNDRFIAYLLFRPSFAAYLASQLFVYVYNNDDLSFKLSKLTIQKKKKKLRNREKDSGGYEGIN